MAAEVRRPQWPQPAGARVRLAAENPALASARLQREAGEHALAATDDLLDSARALRDLAQLVAGLAAAPGGIRQLAKQLAADIERGAQAMEALRARGL